MKHILFSIGLVFLVAGCATTPESISRTPAFSTEAKAGVGQSLYSYNRTGEKLIDYANGETTHITDDLRMELLYGGIANGVIRLTYREFVNDYARPAFSQDASYDFTPGTPTVVSFKGAQIEILEANNNEVTYRVLNGFDGEQVSVGQE